MGRNGAVKGITSSWFLSPCAYMHTHTTHHTVQAGTEIGPGPTCVRTCPVARRCSSGSDVCLALACCALLLYVRAYARTNGRAAPHGYICMPQLCGCMHAPVIFVCTYVYMYESMHYVCRYVCTCYCAYQDRTAMDA